MKNKDQNELFIRRFFSHQIKVFFALKTKTSLNLAANQE